MAPITNVLCLYVFSLGLFVWSTGARESRFFNKEPAYDNPNGGSNNAGYGEGYTNSGVDNSYGAGSGNGYGSYRGQGNGNGYVYGDSDVSRFSSGDGRAGNGYRSGSGRAAEYFSQSAVGNDAGAGYKESSGKGFGYAAGAGYRGEAYGSGSGSGSGADWHGYNGGYAQGGDQYASGHGGRTESNGPYRSAYGSGYFTGSHNGNGYGAGSGIGNAEYVADNGYVKETP